LRSSGSDSALLVTRESILGNLGGIILRLLFLTIRLRVEDRSGLTRDDFRKPIIICFWHNRILAIALTFLRTYPFARRKGVTVLTSASRDGGILARVVGSLGMTAVRGSSSRRGSQAVLELVTLIEEGKDIAITPDGPRGPRYVLGPGAILLAQKTGADLVAVHAKYSRCKRMKSWDGFVVPLPFSSISVTIDSLISIPPDLTPEEFENWRMKLETLLKNEAD